MKTLLLLLALAVSANAIADSTAPTPAGECVKLTAFKGNQDRKLLLSRYGLGLIKADQYEALKKASWEGEQVKVRECLGAL
jgi:hypothetical protein